MKPDKDLVVEAQEGSLQAFSILIERHQRSVLRAAFHITKDLETAEDVIQDSFIKAFKAINKFQHRSSFKSWLYRIVINTAKNKLRSYRREFIELTKVNVAVDPDHESVMELRNIKTMLQSYIDFLPEKQKTVLNLRVFEEMSFTEIAEIMECPYDTAKANYRHGLMKLRKQLSTLDKTEHLSLFENLKNDTKQVYKNGEYI